MPDTAPVESASDLLEYVDYAPARSYIKLLQACANGGVTVGVLDDAVQARAVSDWEAAAMLDHDLAVADIGEMRETLCRKSDLIVRGGDRKGQPTYRLHTDLTGAGHDDTADASDSNKRSGTLFG
jgi:hypothetical protein